MLHSHIFRVVLHCRQNFSFIDSSVPIRDLELQLCETCSLKSVSLQWGQVDWMFRNIGVPCFVCTLEGCHSRLAQAASPAESGARLMALLPPLQRCCNPTGFIAPKGDEQKIWRSQRDLVRTQGWGGDCPASALGSDSWWLLCALWVYWPVQEQSLAAINGRSDLSLCLILDCTLWGKVKNKTVFHYEKPI